VYKNAVDEWFVYDSDGEPVFVATGKGKR